MKCAVVVVHCGIKLPTECRDSVLRYCDKYNLDPVFLNEPRINANGPGNYPYGRFEKYQAREVLNDYDRVLLIDSDTLITNHAPNIFNIVDPSCLGVVREDALGLTASRRRKIKRVQGVMGELGWREGYFNSGVIVASRQHRDIWRADFELDQTLKSTDLGKYKEQKIVNWRARKLKHKIQWLDPRWNYLKMYERKLGLPRTEVFLVHYAGRANRSKKHAIDARIVSSRHHAAAKSLVRQNQVEWIIRQAGTRLGGKALFFGVGESAKMWSKISDASFLEDNVKLYRQQFEDSNTQGLRSYLVNYQTKVRTWESDLANNILNTLPREISDQRYDVIFVNGPGGSQSNSPGRVSPILHAARLVAKNGAIFINDIERNLEQQVSELALGNPTTIHKNRTRIGCWLR